MFTFAPSSYSIISRGERLTLRCEQQFGYVYLIHFHEPYKHARHYLGSASNLEARLACHKHGNGARLMEVIAENGISWHVSRIWRCDSPEQARILEARLKRWNHDGRLCPVCMGRTPDPLALLYAGHQAFHLFDRPGKRQPIGVMRPRFTGSRVVR